MRGKVGKSRFRLMLQLQDRMHLFNVVWWGRHNIADRFNIGLREFCTIRWILAALRFACKMLGRWRERPVGTERTASFGIAKRNGLSVMRHPLRKIGRLAMQIGQKEAGSWSERSVGDRKVCVQQR